MDILHIKNRFIVPLKCGSRFLRKNDWEVKGVKMLENGWESFKNRNWDVIVLRNPMEHLKSALHTELLSLWNDHENWSKYDENGLIETLIGELGTPHWCGILNKILYEVWVDKGKTPKPLKLENLSLFLSLENIDIPQYDPNHYSFKYFNKWETPDYVFNYVKNKYPKEYGVMLEMVNNDEIYFNKFNFLNFEKKIL
jgi:hypothetical protein